MYAEKDVLDVVIIGGGPAGLSTAIWCADLGLRAVLIERDASLGGQLLRIYGPISNYPGVVTKSGEELRDRFALQVENRGVVKLQQTAVSIDVGAKTCTLATGEILESRSIVLAMGVRRRSLAVPGESEFIGRGVLESGVRQSDLARRKTTVVVGGGDAALENALILGDVADKVFLVHRGEGFSGRSEFQNAVRSRQNLHILLGKRVIEIRGSGKVGSVVIEDVADKSVDVLSADLVLVRIGVEPNSDLVRKKLDVDDRGYVLVNHRCETSADGIYAVGDIANPDAPTIAGAVGQGATAAKEISTKINR